MDVIEVVVVCILCDDTECVFVCFLGKKQVLSCQMSGELEDDDYER